MKGNPHIYGIVALFLGIVLLLIAGLAATGLFSGKNVVRTMPAVNFNTNQKILVGWRDADGAFRYNGGIPKVDLPWGASVQEAEQALGFRLPEGTAAEGQTVYFIGQSADLSCHRSYNTDSFLGTADTTLAFDEKGFCGITFSLHGAADPRAEEIDVRSYDPLIPPEEMPAFWKLTKELFRETYGEPQQSDENRLHWSQGGTSLTICFDPDAAHFTLSLRKNP